MEKIFLSTATSYFIALILVPVAIRIFQSINLFDNPDERKLHVDKVPSMGGIPIFLAVFIALPIWLPISLVAANKYLLASCILIFLLGVRDDFVMLRARHKLIAQLVIGLIVISFADIRFHSLYGVLGIYELPYFASIGITLFTFIVITNSFNLIDGIDGLAGTVGMLILGCLGVWFWNTGDQMVSFLCFTTVGAIFAFLYFNWQPAKIFMGDTGSLFIGFLIAIFTVKFIDVNYFLKGGHVFKYTSHIAMGVGLLSVPLFDTLRVFILRVRKGTSPMVPDRNHLHHRLLEMGFPHRKSSLILLSTNIFFAILAYLMRDFGNLISLVVLISTACLLNLMLSRQHGKVLLNENNSKEDNTKQIYLNKSA